jgi:branched-chain amino acid transport system permease protein
MSAADRLAAHRPSAAVAAVRSLWPLLVGLAAAYLVDRYAPAALGPTWSRILLNTGLAVVLAVSLNIVNGYAGQFSLGHAGFMMVGGYAAAWMTYYLSILWWGSAARVEGFLGSGELLFLASCAVAGCVAALFGLLVGLPSLRLRGDYLAIVTLGFGEIIRVAVQMTTERLRPAEVKGKAWHDLLDNLGGPLGFGSIPKYTNLFWVFAFVAVVLLVAYRLKTSSLGRGLLAVRENEVAAEAMGVDTVRAKVTAFVLAAFFAGIGGALFAHQTGNSLNPGELGFQKSIDLVIIVVIGGMGSISGVVFGAAIVTVLPEVFREFAEYRMIVFALALVVVMILRPQGIMGVRELWETAWWRRLAARLRRPGRTA